MEPDRGKTRVITEEEVPTVKKAHSGASKTTRDSMVLIGALVLYVFVRY